MQNNNNKTRKVKPASYSPASFTDERSVALIKYILSSHKRVMPHLESQDKRPNIDGYLEVQDIHFQLVGKLEAQVKTLPLDHNFKYQCDTAFLRYCEQIATLPVLLLLVDHGSKKVYWLHIHQKLIQTLDYKEDQKSKLINFKKDQFLDQINCDYINFWELIARDYREKFRQFDDLKSAYEVLANHSNKAIGKTFLFYYRVHYFLDELNQLLDRKFNIVKRIFYPNQWKIGLAYFVYEAFHVRYVLYPIPWDKNDVQIKEVDEKLHLKLENQGLEFIAYYQENPIETRPIQHAIEIVKNKLETIIKYKLLDLTGSIFLISEFMFAFINRFHIQLGLEIKDSYSIEEMENAFNKHLPIWVEENVNFKVKRNCNDIQRPEECLTLDSFRNGLAYYDPTFLARTTRPEEIDLIAKEVQRRLRQPNCEIKNWPIGNKEFPFGFFNTYLESLRSKGVDRINRLYKPLDFSRISNGGPFWNSLSIEDLKYNLDLFFDQLVCNYDRIVNDNFPLLREEFSFFKEVDKVLISFRLKDEYMADSEAPSYNMFFLKSEHGFISRTIQIISEDEAVYLGKGFEDGTVVEYTGEKYKVISIRWGSLDLIYCDLPMFDYVYKILEERITNNI